MSTDNQAGVMETLGLSDGFPVPSGLLAPTDYGRRLGAPCGALRL